MSSKSSQSNNSAEKKKEVPSLAPVIGREKFKTLDREARKAAEAAKDFNTERSIWFDTTRYETRAQYEKLLTRLPQAGYTGVILAAKDVNSTKELVAASLALVVHVTTLDDALRESLLSLTATGRRVIVASPDLKITQACGEEGLSTCYRGYVDDAQTLHDVIELGQKHNFLTIKFKDPTNIPLELVIASLQKSQTVLLKEIQNEDLDDAIVSLGVMEFGADGVVFTTTKHEQVDQFQEHITRGRSGKVKIEVATIVSARPVGMGYRGCIDLATLFTETEGMLVGSTSQGGFLACPEVFFLPYMDLRPFRVNAGAVHSYVYGPRDRTAYMTELRAGSEVEIVGLDGTTRKAVVGRVKTEMRPLRLIEAKFDSGDTINVLMQDDWHVRIFGEDGKPKNISELKAGDRVLAHPAETGRHVGIKISENIVEV